MESPRPSLAQIENTTFERKERTSPIHLSREGARLKPEWTSKELRNFELTKKETLGNRYPPSTKCD
jgi:hypothetical protein